VIANAVDRLYIGDRIKFPDFYVEDGYVHEGLHTYGESFVADSGVVVDVEGAEWEGVKVTAYVILTDNMQVFKISEFIINKLFELVDDENINSV